nr:bifunctional glutamate N-acetyltransferase/amino-acid acetyltransferase ArgJ [Pseudomonadota bacterium]
QASVAEIVRTTADVLKTEPSRIFTSSTGVIGEPLDPAPICAMLPALHDNLRDDSLASAARAIMTTDTFAKGAFRQIIIDGQPILIGGFAKGSGMIAPDMATMLAYIFTDARVTQPDLQAMLTATNETSFNAISVDGDTSTSDALMMIATGKSGVDASDNAAFRTALGEVMHELAQAIVRDGEGATKLITIKITGATSPQSAKIIAQSIANSPLVKTAIAGEDPNWGRIVMAVGKAGQPADRDKLRIWFGDILVAEHGAVAVGYDEQTTADYMKNERIDLHVDLAIGTGDFTMWSCDFTHDYIRINADYRS